VVTVVPGTAVLHLANLMASFSRN